MTFKGMLVMKQESVAQDRRKFLNYASLIISSPFAFAKPLTPVEPLAPSNCNSKLKEVFLSNFNDEPLAKFQGYGYEAKVYYVKETNATNVTFERLKDPPPPRDKLIFAEIYVNDKRVRVHMMTGQTIPDAYLGQVKPDKGEEVPKVQVSFVEKQGSVPSKPR